MRSRTLAGLLVLSALAVPATFRAESAEIVENDFNLNIP